MAVAYSGGRDSTALLHATLMAVAGTGLAVAALHVQHGLSPNAEDWLAHCERQCADWARHGHRLAFAAVRLERKPPPGASVEAWAREQRYSALGQMARERGASVVLLAQHRRDQAETLLLQALRGAGVAGLSGMPRAAQRGGVSWLRPWLDRSRDDIDAYVRLHQLAHIDDESNHDRRYARNRLRLDVWPALVGAFAHAETSLAAAAAWAGEAAAALEELAAIDLALVSRGHQLDVAAWLQLSAARRSLALRTWLKACVETSPSAALVTRLLAELPACRRGARWPCGQGELRRDGGLLAFHGEKLHKISVPLPADSTLSVLRAGTYTLREWAGRLRVEQVGDGGIPLAWLARLEVRGRRGAEQFQAGPGRPPRSLKKQFQAASVPAWARAAPLFFSGGQLVYVPGLGADARVIGLQGQELVSLTWLPFVGAGSRVEPA